MDEDWDLHALVRSYTTSPTTTTISTAAAAESDSSKTREDPFGSLAILINHEEDNNNNNNPFHFPNLLSDPKTKYNPFEELQQLYKPFFPTAAAAVVSAAITAPLMKPPPPRLPLPPPPSPFVSELTNNGGILDRNPRAGPSSSSSLSFGPRSRRRKNQQKKVVKQVTAESLSSDMWAWRKYGQKPIKGSPYPRNYYRCSSSKGCPARKQVERSNSDPNMFNITYTGEHTHPRPTHRNSLAGSTRNKFPTAATATADDDNNKNNNPENPSRFASSSLSPTTPLLIPPIMDFEVGIETNNDDDDDADVDGGDDEDEEMNGADQTVDDDDDADEEERNILIPNLAMNEDIFMGLQELTDHGLKTGIKSQPSKYTHRLSAIALAGAGKTTTISAARSGGC